MENNKIESSLNKGPQKRGIKHMDYIKFKLL